MNTDETLTAIRDVIQHDAGKRGLARDPNDNLLTATRNDFAKACKSIADQPNPLCVIVTGFFIPTATPPAGETDGPLGALFLARAFSQMGIHSAILTDPFCVSALVAGLSACDLTEQVELWEMPEKITPEFEARFAFVSHRIAIERAGPAADGRCYTMRGRDITELMRPAHLLFDRPQIARSALVSDSQINFASGATKAIPKFVSIGIGDGGNEIGMGKIAHETIVRNIPNGDQTHCRTATDHLIVAGVSNWGGYALAAGVSLLRGVQLRARLFDSEEERRTLQVMVDRGPLVDGVSGRISATVDGLSWESYAAPLTEIGKIVTTV
jgi:hypothetical protein